MYKKKRMSLMKLFESITEDNKKGKMVSLFIPASIGSKLQNMFKDIKGEKVSPEDMHITLGLMYGDENEDKKVSSILRDLSSRLNPVDINISDFGVFGPSGSSHNKYVLWAKPSSDSIHYLRDTVFDLFKKHGLKIDNGSHDFTPHITIKYCDEEPEIDSRLTDSAFRIKNLSFASGGKKIHFPFGRVGDGA